MRFQTFSVIGAMTAGLVLGLAAADTANAAPRHYAPHHKSVRAGAYRGHGGIRFAAAPSRGGGALVSDGPGTGYGFHRLPGQFRVGAHIQRDRQTAALHEAVETDALTSGSYRGGFLGDDVAGGGPSAHYGVFSGADGYGSPYFAGYYGPGGGEDLGVLGHTYD